jgi:agmatine deiminase
MHSTTTPFPYAAEWDAQQSVLLAWPHKEKNWGEDLPALREFYQEWIATIRRFQPVTLVVPPELLHTLPDFGDASYPLNILTMATDDLWIRDYSPFYMQDAFGKKYLLEFTFNAWGAKFPPWNNDNLIPSRISAHSQNPHLPLRTLPWVFEGGAFEYNGAGIGMTTRTCLYGEFRNTENNAAMLEADFCQAFGLEELIILSDGLAGDHTDGHIDNLARFTAPDHIVFSATDDPQHFQYENTQKSLEELRDFIKRKDLNINITLLPLPPAIEHNGETLPRSYANFIYLNGALLVPVFGEAEDKQALDILQKLHPERKVIGMNASLLICEGGGLHCASRQVSL